MLRQDDTHHTGRGAEALARLWLRCKGWRILAMRTRTPAGEIDIIARRGSVLAFVEVKHRRSLRDAAHALRPAQQRRICRAAALWLARRPAFRALDVRFDLVVLAPGLRIRHLEDAFRPGEGWRDMAFSL